MIPKVRAGGDSEGMEILQLVCRRKRVFEASAQELFEVLLNLLKLKY